MHHDVLGLTDFSNGEVHHINGNKLDNCRWNLKYLNFQAHQMTRPKQSNNQSGFKGVHWKAPQGTRRGAWIAQIGNHKTRLYIGRYATAEEAARAYDEKAYELYGEIAQLNFPR